MIQGTCWDTQKKPVDSSLKLPEGRFIRRFVSRQITFLIICGILVLIAPPALSDPVDSVEITAHISPILFGNITVGQISTSGAQISWFTTSPSDSWVYYDTISHPNAEEYAFRAGNDIYTITHLLVLSGLRPGTTFHFRIRSNGPGGVSITSGDLVFRTISIPPTGGSGGGGGGGSYGSFFSVVPFTSPVTTIPTPLETPLPIPPSYGPGSGNVTHVNESMSGNATPTIPTGEIILERSLLSFIKQNLCLIFILLLVILALILIYLYARRRRKED